MKNPPSREAKKPKKPKAKTQSPIFADAARKPFPVPQTDTPPKQ